MSSQWVNYNIPQDTLDRLPWEKDMLAKHKNGLSFDSLAKKAILMWEQKIQNSVNGNGLNSTPLLIILFRLKGMFTKKS